MPDDTRQLILETARLLQSMFARVPCDTYLTLWRKHIQGWNKTDWFPATPEGITQLAASAMAIRDNADAYFSTCPGVAVPVETPDKCRISQRDVASVPLLFVDVDAQEGEKKVGKKLPGSKEDAVRGLQALSLSPSIIVDSGHGMHAYWLLQAPLSADEGAKLWKRFAKAIRAATGWVDLDAVEETSRLARIPNTLNHKETPPLAVKAREGGTGAVYSLVDIEHFITSVSDPFTKNKSAQPDGMDSDATGGGAENRAALPDPDGHRTRPMLTDEEIIQLASKARDGAKFTALFHDGDMSGYSGDASRSDAALCAMLAFWTHDDAEQMDALFRQSALFRRSERAHKWDMKHKADGATYGEMTINFAISQPHAVYEGKHADPSMRSSEMQRIFDAFGKVHPYGIQDGQIVRTKQTQQGEEIVPLSTFSALIVKEITRDDGVGKAVEYCIEGRDRWGGLLEETRVKVNQYGKMDWVADAWGTRASIYPGTSAKDHVRFAIAEASNKARPPIQREAEFAHMGWTTINGRLVYLFHGGAVGVQGVSVELEGELTGYCLPSTVRDAQRAIHASLEVLNVAPAPVVIPTYAFAFLAPLCHFLHRANYPPAFTLYLAGGTGTRKTTLAALVLAHFGAEWNNKRLPANFNDTSNALMQKAFLCKDAPLLVDDFRPSATQKERRNLDEKAQRLATGWGDYAARSRLRADSSMDATKPPRGIGMITGEDAPNITESGTARFYIVQVGRHDIPVSQSLQQAQAAGREGLLAEAMRAYIEWLAGRNSPDLIAVLGDAFTQYRDEANRELTGAHGRSAEAIAHLWLALRSALDCFRSYGAIEEAEGERLWCLGRQAILDNARVQRDEMQHEKPTRMFLEAVFEMVSSGKAYLHPLKSLYPPNFQAPVIMLGYYDETYIYFIPGVVYGALCGHFQGQGGAAFPLSKITIFKRLGEEGYLHTRPEDGSTSVKHVPYKGKSERLLTIKRAALSIMNWDPAAGLSLVPSEADGSGYVADR